MAKISIFAPSRIYGGAERQMALLAQQAADDGHEVELIDSSIGVIAKLLQHRQDISLKVYDWREKVAVKNSIVITQASYTFCLPRMLDMENCKVRFWFMHPLNLPHMYLCSRFGTLFGSLFRALLSPSYRDKLASVGQSLYFQSEDTRMAVENFYDIELPNNNTGLLSEVRGVDPVDANSVCGTELELSWLGRLDTGSKYLAIKKLLTDLTTSRHFENVSRLNIIGDGPARGAISSYIKDKGLGQKVILHGHIDYALLPSLLKRSLIVFAHGTSVYEGVVCQVPVCVVDFYQNQNQIRRMKYRLYSDDNDPTLGFLITDSDDPRINHGRAFDTLIQELNAPSTIANIAHRQILKYKKAITRGKKGCRILYSINAGDCSYRHEMLLDFLFFRFRIFYIRLKNRRV